MEDLVGSVGAWCRQGVRGKIILGGGKFNVSLRASRGGKGRRPI